MLPLRLAVLAVVFLVALLPAAGTAQETPAPTPDWAARAAERLPLLEPCQVDGIEETVLCGILDVPEDRSVPAEAPGRTIGLHVVVVPARAEEPPADPITYFAGGPGGVATRRAVALSHVAALRGRDLFFVDQRGTGSSDPLDCDLGSSEGVVGELPEMFPPADVRACAERLGRDRNLSLYTSAQHADDVEDLRRRLGFGPLNIQGGSYGTHAAMTFAQRHPESVRTLFLMGVDSPLRSNLAERSVWTERTLAGLAAACGADSDCARLTPDLFRQLSDLFSRLDETPRTVRVPDPAHPDELLELTLRRDWLAEQTRLVLYYGFTSRGLPWAVHRAHAENDWVPLARLALFIDRFFQGTLADGVLLAVQCSEMMGFDPERALRRGEGTLFGNYRLAQQLQGCAHWPHEPADTTLGVDPPRPLETPTLFLSGRWDPVTPPAYAEDASAYFPRSHHVILDEGQHGPYDLQNGWTCVHEIWADFLERGTVDGLDTSCTAGMTRQPFLTDGEAFDAYFEGTLVPLLN